VHVCVYIPIYIYVLINIHLVASRYDIIYVIYSPATHLVLPPGSHFPYARLLRPVRGALYLLTPEYANELYRIPSYIQSIVWQPPPG